MAFEKLNYPERWKEAEQHLEENVQDVDDNDITYAANKGKMKLKRLGSPPKGMEEVWQDLHVMVALCQDYLRKDYQDISWKSLQRIAGAVTYFVTPFDVIPDVVSKIGYLDDAAVIRWALSRSQEDLERYRAWQIDRGEKLAHETSQ